MWNGTTVTYWCNQKPAYALEPSPFFDLLDFFMVKSTNFFIHVIHLYYIIKARTLKDLVDRWMGRLTELLILEIILTGLTISKRYSS